LFIVFLFHIKKYAKGITTFVAPYKGVAGIRGLNKQIAPLPNPAQPDWGGVGTF